MREITSDELIVALQAGSVAWLDMMDCGELHAAFAVIGNVVLGEIVSVSPKNGETRWYPGQMAELPNSEDMHWLAAYDSMQWFRPEPVEPVDLTDYGRVNPETVEEIFRASFPQTSSLLRRSDAYKLGTLHFLRAFFDGNLRMPTPYTQGTADADAYAAGMEAGIYLWHSWRLEQEAGGNHA